MKRFGLTIAAMIRNEGRYLAEWLEYHGLIGFEHFYLYDNGSTDDTTAVLRDYVVQGRVTLLSWPEGCGQTSAYNHAVKIFGRDSEWMALIDLDEFVRVDAGLDLRDVLASLEPADQVLLPWFHFDSAGHDEPPASLVIEAYTFRVGTAHRQPKAIVRPEAVLWAEVHHCLTRGGRTTDPAGTPLPERWILDRPPEGPIRVNHYFTKSRSEFATKVARGQADGGRGKTMDAFDRFVCPVRDNGLAAFGPAVREAIDATRRRSTRSLVHAAWSAQSEISPSRGWTLRAQQALRRLCATLPEDAVTGRDGSVDREFVGFRPGTRPPAAELFETFRLDLGARLVCAAATPGSPQVLVRECFGRPYLALASRCAGATTFDLVAEGRDAGGKPTSARLSLDLPDGEAVALAILSERTMTIDRLSVRASDAIIDVAAEIATFT